MRTFAYSTPGELTLYTAHIEIDGAPDVRRYVAPDLETAFQMATHRLRKNQRLVGIQERDEIDSVCLEITKALGES